MEQERVVFFLDYANINRAARDKRYRLDYRHLLGYMAEERFLIDAHCYVPINPRSEHRIDGVIEELWRSGYVVTTKLGTIAGGTYKCNFDVEIAIDVLRTISQVKPDILVLASGDADFVPLICEVRKAGVRIEVAAFAETVGADLLRKCSGFIDLAVYYAGYLAARNGTQAEERIAQRYADLMQSQLDEQRKDGSAPPEQDLLSPHEDEADEGAVSVPGDQAETQASVSAPDISDDLEV